MKKNKFLKMFLTFVCILAISIVSEHVYGYDLKYKAYSGFDTTKVYFVTMGNAFGKPDITASFEKSNQLLDLTKESVYQSYKFMIQTGSMTKYTDNSEYDIKYAASNGIIDENNFSNYDDYNYSTKSTGVSGKNSNVYTNEILRGVGNKGANIVSVYDMRNNECKGPFFF